MEDFKEIIEAFYPIICIILFFVVMNEYTRAKNKEKDEEARLQKEKEDSFIKEKVDYFLNRYRERIKGHDLENVKDFVYIFGYTFKIFVENNNLYILPGSEDLIIEVVTRELKTTIELIEENRMDEERAYKRLEDHTSFLFDENCIPLDRIEYYQQEGQISYHTEIYGGGGGGSSLGGALVGGLIAGEAGAIIGSRKESNPIWSKQVENDNRKTWLHYINENNKSTVELFNYYDYNTFEKLIPDKSYEIVKERKKLELLADQYKEVKKLQEESMSKDLTNQTNDAGNKTNPEEEITTQIEKLFQLKEKGILTEDEFIEKKRELLSKI